MQKFNDTDLNPNCDITAKEVYEVDIEEVFGKVVKFKTTNIQLHANTKKDLLYLCSHIYDMSNVTNNELMSWAMKGYIAQMKGCDVNWAKVATSIMKKKMCRLVVDKLKSGKSSNVSWLSLKEVSCKIEPGDVVCKNSSVLKGTRGKGTCPYGVPPTELT